ncbi:MAG: TorF family putative porin [Methylophaga sp.]
MKTFKLNHLVLLMAGTVISSASFADSGQAEVGPAKAAKESVAFVDYLDREEVFGGKFSTWVEFASDYVFRGESETNDGDIPSLKGAITWTHNTGVYLGYYLANNMFPGNDSEGNNPKINAIWGPYVGYSTQDIAGTGLNYNGMFFQYVYPGDRDSNYLEMFNYVDKQFGKVNMKLEYSPTLTDWFGVEDLQSHNIAIHPSYSLPHGFTLSGSLGYQFFNNSGPNLDANGNGKEELDWTHWSVGISRNVFGFNVDLRYHDTDIKEGKHDFYGFDNNHQIVDERYVISVSKSF